MHKLVVVTYENAILSHLTVLAHFLRYFCMNNSYKETQINLKTNMEIIQITDIIKIRNLYKLQYNFLTL